VTKAPVKAARSKPINLALQGGGAHGAFTWGVLDRLLADGRIDLEGLSGTSAGAMNAIVLAAGMARDGRDGARAALEAFWREVSEEARLSPIRRSPIDVFMDNWNLDSSPALVWFDLMSRLVSPYEFNPLNLNPLKQVLERSVEPGQFPTIAVAGLAPAPAVAWVQQAATVVLVAQAARVLTPPAERPRAPE
jgi:NTE family protein